MFKDVPILGALNREQEPKLNPLDKILYHFLCKLLSKIGK